MPCSARAAPIDFIHQVIAEENLNVKICCALPGLTTGYGPSHQATEDIAMMRGVPGLTIVDPCDALDLEQAVPQIAAHQGPGLHAPGARQRACWCSTRCQATSSSSARPSCCATATTC